MPTLATALLEGLKAYGASEIFGIPGDFVLPFFKVIEESRILPFYTLSHEPAVGFAADVAARYQSGLGVAVVTYGAGAFNLVNAVAGAYAERSPVVVVAGAPSARERVSGLLLHHQVAPSIPSLQSIARLPATRRYSAIPKPRPSRSRAYCAARASARCRSISSFRATW